MGKTGGVLYIEPPSMCVSYLSIDGIDLRTLPRADFFTITKVVPCRPHVLLSSCIDQIKFIDIKRSTENIG